MKLFSAGLDNMLRRSDKIQARPVYMWGCFLTRDKKSGSPKIHTSNISPMVMESLWTFDKKLTHCQNTLVKII